MAETPTPQIETERSGVFYSDAPDGYRALVVFMRGRRVIRLEIADEFFSAPWVLWLERWLRKHSKSANSLTLIP